MDTLTKVLHGRLLDAFYSNACAAALDLPPGSSTAWLNSFPLPLEQAIIQQRATFARRLTRIAIIRAISLF